MYDFPFIIAKKVRNLEKKIFYIFKKISKNIVLKVI